MPAEREPAGQPQSLVEAPVARWEIWSVTTMLIKTHSVGAEEKAEQEIATAIEQGHAGNLHVWRSFRIKLDEIRAERSTKGA